MAAVVLTPRQRTIHQTVIDGWHGSFPEVFSDSQTFGPQQFEDFSSRNRGHETSTLVEPVGIAFFGNAVTDESQSRRTQRDQFMRIDR